ncbi:hypothetical protein [Wenxinia marina]|uniref:Uncharacterized protein n=1 Tax=Wenxinia marina DSM 24838 TaxID=1123501 RepID=A0A0D0PE05_9RHOB|nr:hypothetical protein [Wenxinia marina]KIQ69646.1 hypothetical protein Wenmar_02010 [Wenxinia marina DSM 24838]GGL60013.1 hypothetical protein GCM10011392_13170 [Wenxinia marina]
MSRREKRWIAPAAHCAATLRTRLPWQRGLRREAFVVRRRAAEIAARRLALRAIPAA